MAEQTPIPSSPGDEGVLQRRYREVTVSSIIFGVVFGAIMNAAITYAGLKIGFTIVGSAIAAVLGFGVLRGLLRRGSILETNIGQTIASAVNTTNAGVIFTVPVLLLLGDKITGSNGEPFSLTFGNKEFWLITLACMAGAVLGCVFIVPLRKQMLDIDRLRFPSAVAVGAILKSPGAGAAKTIVLLAGIVVAMLIYLPAGLPQLRGPGGDALPGYGALGWTMAAETHAEGGTVTVDGVERPRLSMRVDRDQDGVPDQILTDDTFDLGRLLGLPDQIQLMFAIAPFALGAGYLTGRAGLLVLAGGILAYFVLNPIAYAQGWLPEVATADQTAGKALGAFNRPLGIGLLLGGAAMGILAALPAVKEAFKAVGSASKTRTAGGTTIGGDEMGFKPLFIIAAIAIGTLFVAAEFVGGATGSDPSGWLYGLPAWLIKGIVVIVAAAWIWFAGIIIAQCTGMTDWSPISGMALLTVVLVMMLGGKNDILSAVMIGAALCVAISCAADMMGDLKTGYIVGAQPRRQQVVEIACAAIGPVITMATIVLIAQVNMKNFGVPIGPGTQTVAPQAQALSVIIDGVRGGELPYALYGFGAAVGALLGLAAFPSLGVLVGLSMYLPIIYILTYGIGCVVQMIVSKVKGSRWAEEWGVPFAAGLIVGEAILSLIINAIVLLQG